MSLIRTSIIVFLFGLLTVGHGAEKTIPGLTADEFVRTLKEQGFTTSTNRRENVVSWTGTRNEQETQVLVAIQGSSPKSLTALDATIVDTTGNIKSLAVIFLGHIATLGRNDEEAGEIRSWLGDNVLLREKAQVMIGKTRLQIDATGSTKITFSISSKQ